jgi:NAD(P)-dependent dehydrogenase (short-subunit alcohol dehydrogenase family)
MLPAVVITGASTGIGEACALALDRRGYAVFAGVRRPEDGARLTVRASTALRWIPLDVTDAEQIASAARSVAEATGSSGIAGLVNNAGIAVGGPLEYVSLEEVRRQFEVNVLGLLAVTQAFLPLLRAARGRIVNIGSISGRAVTPMVAPYCASKHAVAALNDGLRLELAEAGIAVSLIEPGAVRTPIWEKGVADLAKARVALPAAALERYAGKFALFQKLLRENEEQGVEPEAVVAAVVDALEAERPRAHYLIGGLAKARAFLVRFFPTRVADAIVLAVLRRKEASA